MDRGDKILIAVFGVIIIALAGGYAALHMTSGLDGSPFSVVMSSSMQHDNTQSELGVIDTGDVVTIKSPDKVDIESYIHAISTGYKSFGDYGNVIIYERGGDKNPVIHRAIVWMDYNGNGTWSCGELENIDHVSWETYQQKSSAVSGLAWTCSGSSDMYSLSGTFVLINVTQSEKTVSVNLDNLGKNSGYLTMGDNPVTNGYFDQTGIITHPIGNDSIRAVALGEIPWMGVIKVFLDSDKNQYLSKVPNSVNILIMLVVMIIIFIVCCDFYHMKNENAAKRDKIAEIREQNI